MMIGVSASEKKRQLIRWWDRLAFEE